MSTGVGIGEVLAGKYRVDAVLGEGGMGVVFAAHHLDLGRTVAIKVMRQDLGGDDSLVQRLMFEARAAARIQSEHVCQVLDVSRLDDGTPFIVMEHLAGLDLSSVLASQGPLRERRAADYVLQACEPLAEAHRAGIVHRDLKPENLFLAHRADGSELIKVLDFGISKATSASALRMHAAHTIARSTLGSPYYMAPEQMAARGDLDARSDIWALGAILYHLTTGRLPFDGETFPEICAVVLRAQPIPPRQLRPELSEEIERIILRCLLSERDLRFSSVAQLAQALAPCASERAFAMAERASRILNETMASASRRDGAPNPDAASDGSDRSNSTLQPTSISGSQPAAQSPADPLSSHGRADAASQIRAKPLGWVMAGLILLGAVVTVSVVTTHGTPARNLSLAASKRPIRAAASAVSAARQAASALPVPLDQPLRVKPHPAASAAVPLASASSPTTATPPPPPRSLGAVGPIRRGSNPISGLSVRSGKGRETTSTLLAGKPQDAWDSRNFGGRR